MRCPSCRKPMIVLEVEKVEIDHCTACGGVWLDGGELELLLEAASNKDELMRTLAELTEGRAKKKRCPICARKLHQVKYGPERDLVLDRCTRGHGIWFDRDELCRALQFGRFERGRPVYDVLNDVFGGTCRNAPPDGPRTGGPSEEGVSKGS